MQPSPWERVDSERHADCRVFNIERRRLRRRRDGAEDDFFVIDAHDWAVALALTQERDLVMVEQFRYGAEKFSWEFPAGCVDAGETPLEAAQRELAEESGYVGKAARVIAQCHPNPAMQDNTCTFVLIENAECRREVDWDGHEEMRVAAISLSDVRAQLKEGKIHHAIAVAAFQYLCWALEDA